MEEMNRKKKKVICFYPRVRHFKEEKLSWFLKSPEATNRSVISISISKKGLAL